MTWLSNQGTGLADPGTRVGHDCHTHTHGSGMVCQPKSLRSRPKHLRLATMPDSHAWVKKFKFL